MCVVLGLHTWVSKPSFKKEKEKPDLTCDGDKTNQIITPVNN